MKLFNRKIDSRLLVVIFAIGLYSIGMSLAAIHRYRVFRACAFDMAIDIQTIWNLTQGRLLEESINLGFPTPRFWVAHWEFIFIPIALLFKLLPSPGFVLIIQSVVLALGAIPVYWLAKDKLKNHFAGVGLAFSYLLYPAMQNANLADVHGITFVTPMLLYTFYFLQKRRVKLFGLFAFLSLLCREDAALILFMFGLYAIVILKEKKLGTIVSILSIFWFLIFLKRAAIRSALGLPPIPVFEGVPSHWDHLKAVLDNPLYLIDHLAKKYNITYFINLFAPLGLLSLFSPVTLILVAPTLSINLLSDWFFAHDIQHQYTSTITPIVFISAIYGFQNISAFIEKKFSVPRQKVIYFISIAVILLSFFFCVSKSNILKVYHWKVTEHHQIIDKVISLIPPEASLCADAYLAPHTAMRRELYVFPQHKDKVEFVLYDFNARQIKLWTKPGFELYPFPPLNSYIKDMLLNQNYGIFHYEDGVILFKRGVSYEEGLRKLAIAQEGEISQLMEKSITDEVSFIGYNNHEGSIMWFYFPDTGLVIKKIVHFTVYWRALSDNLEDFNFDFNLQTDQAQFTFSNDPVFGLYPPSRWRANEVIRDEIFWEVPQEAKSGKYSISVSVNNSYGNSSSIPLFDIIIDR
ncbi:MAG: DUF2079 domain-containing protein [candidate division KSB1 bacterium]|nr:DUF2079 domain-containing protein [candidate division KSB1 bacterium]